MKSTNEHRKRLKEIANLALDSGMSNSGIDFNKIKSPNEITPEQWTNFLHTCNDGYKKAQKLIITEIIDYQAQLTQLKIEITKARVNRNKEGEKEFKSKEEIIQNRISAFMHIADSIAWPLLGQQISNARRLHIEEKGNKFLSNSNIEHAIKVADEINKNPADFALISDITNFIQIGDLLILKGGKIGVMELKEGEVNDQIADYLKNLESKSEEIDDVELKKVFDAKTVKQVKRVVRQKKRMDQSTSLIQEDKGIDPVSGRDMTIRTPTVTTEHYYDELKSLITDLESKNWSYGMVEGCLHIGMYKEEAFELAPVAIPAILKMNTENFFIVDWATISSAISEPIFNKPFPEDFILDVLVGKIKVVIGLNLDMMMELFTDLGLTTTWMSTKQTTKIKQEKIRSGLVEKDNRGISMTSPKGRESIMFGGIISKIFYDNIRPSNIALTILEADEEEIDVSTND